MRVLVTTGAVMTAVGIGTAYAVSGQASSEGAERVPSVMATNGAGAASWVPDGSRLGASHVPDDGSGSASYSYILSGGANSDTMDEAALAANPRSLAVHPATEITVHFAPAITEQPELMADEKFFEISTVDVNGSTATVSTPRNGLGAHRIEWVDDRGYHVVLCDRIRTDHGVSGVDTETLLKVSRSV